jgi:putative ABC transport system ATP-binding protein
LTSLEFQNVSYSHGGKDILHNLSLTVSSGDYISIVGPSGSGKSTFLKLCCHLISPTEGKILFHGKDMLQQGPTELRKKISYCFQEPVLWGSTVRDNLAFPYQIRSMKPDWEKAAALLSDFSMDKSCLAQDIGGLSGGERQRVALVRTILFEPEILLLDEVTSALDAENTALVEKAVLGLNRKGITVLWVTHNTEQSRKYANKLMAIEDGRIKSLEAIR